MKCTYSIPIILHINLTLIMLFLKELGRCLCGGSCPLEYSLVQVFYLSDIKLIRQCLTLPHICVFQKEFEDAKGADRNR